MKMPPVLITALAALTLCAISTVALRAQTGDWSEWVKTDVDGISTSYRCTYGHGNGGRDVLIARLHNAGASDFTGWWSISYNGSDPNAKKNESSHQKIVVKAGSITGGANTVFTAAALCVSGPAVNVGT